jgi:hypothetical protein
LIIARRLSAQRLVGPGLASAAAVVREQGAVQSQDFFGAKWALSQRIAGAGSTEAAIEQAFSRGEILRTHVLRPTWHFVTPEDLRWMLTLTGPRIDRLMDYYGRRLGLTPGVYRRCRAVLERSLSGGVCLTRTQIAAALRRANVPVVNGQALARIMMKAETEAVVVSGPRRGKQFTYALVEERVPRVAAKDRDDALQELARRYFTTRGPATAHDCAWWSGLTTADVKRGIEIAGKALTREEIDGREYWRVERDLYKPGPVAHLLPNYDEYFIGYKDRSAIGGRIGSVGRVTGGDALVEHVVTVNGELVGGWKRTSEGKHALVTISLAVRLSAAERRRIDAQVARLAGHLGTVVGVGPDPMAPGTRRPR